MTEDKTLTEIIAFSGSIVHAHTEMMATCQQLAELARQHKEESQQLRAFCIRMYADLNQRTRDKQDEFWLKKLREILLPKAA